MLLIILVILTSSIFQNFQQMASINTAMGLN